MDSNAKQTELPGIGCMAIFAFVMMTMIGLTVAPELGSIFLWSAFSAVSAFVVWKVIRWSRCRNRFPAANLPRDTP
jgi:hypothetical protein